MTIVYPDGRLCISILHPPGDDPVSGEKAEVSILHHVHLCESKEDDWTKQSALGTMESNTGER